MPTDRRNISSARFRAAASARQRALIPVAVVGVLLTAACGSSSTTSGTPSSVPSSSVTSTSVPSTSATQPASSGQPSSPGASAVKGTVCDEHPAWSEDSAQALPITVPAATRTVPRRRLVPDARATAMTVCEYRLDASTRQATLTAERRVSNPDAAQAHLGAESPVGGRPAHCTMMTQPTIAYLARLDYAGGSAWVGVAGFNACNGTTNGHTISATSDARRLQQAVDNGMWPA